jgi:hypothetical protein
MALETTTTTLTELVYGEWISPFIQSYAANYQNPSQFLAKWNPANGSSTVSVPRWVSDQGDVNDDGAAVDTEFAATEGSDLANTELETLDSTFSIAEFGLMREVTDTVLESAQSAESLLSFIVPDGASILMAAANDDVCALFASFTNSSGTTTANLTVADIDDALYDLAERGAQGELVGILDHQQIRDFQDALQATGTSMAVYAASADRQMNTSFDGKQGRNVEGYVLDYKGVPFYRNGLCDTANAAADVVGAIFVRGDLEAQRSTAAIGQGSLREFRVATERNESKRTTEVIMTMRWGCGITHNIMGQEVTTDAP